MLLMALGGQGSVLVKIHEIALDSTVRTKVLARWLQKRDVPDANLTRPKSSARRCSLSKKRGLPKGGDGAWLARCRQAS